ncbi:hypothetical protein R1flu_006180 [Riccia fluitans]|uniref:Secreted protein n=1 Tax=Riccia fluitans TaxID=41844 RepID=A0ABD1YVW4_9MARC
MNFGPRFLRWFIVFHSHAFSRVRILGATHTPGFPQVLAAPRGEGWQAVQADTSLLLSFSWIDTQIETVTGRNILPSTSTSINLKAPTSLMTSFLRGEQQSGISIGVGMRSWNYLRRGGCRISMSPFRPCSTAFGYEVATFGLLSSGRKVALLAVRPRGLGPPAAHNYGVMLPCLCPQIASAADHDCDSLVSSRSTKVSNNSAKAVRFNSTKVIG